MTGQGQNLLSGINFFFVCLAFFCLPIMAHAGGLGVAAVAAIAGCVAILTGSLAKFRDVPRWAWALMAFLGWAFISAFWSPYENPHTLSNPVKLVIGVGLFFSFDLGVKAANARAPKKLRRLVIGFIFTGLAFLLIDLLFPYSVTYLVDPLGPDEHVFHKTGDILMNLGHAVAVYTVLIGMVAGVLGWGGRFSNGLLLGFIGLLLVAAISHTLAVGVLGLLAALIAMGLAKLWPRLTLLSLTSLSVLSILVAPLMGFVARNMSPEMKARLPISWEHRVEIWSYVLTKIEDHPIIGYGFDGVRTFNGTYTSRGLEFKYMPLHPHSAGLHIWVETGVVGAVLASFTLALIGLYAIKAVSHRPELAVPFAGFAAAAIVICTVTFGVWQDWWWASLIMAASIRHLIPSKHKL